MSRKTVLAALIGLALTIGVPFALGGAASFEALAGMPPALLAAVAGLALTAGVAKAGKLHVLWRHLGPRPAFGRSLAISLAGDFAFLATPAGAGGYVLSVALLRRSGASWSMATSVVGAEQALDLVFFALFVPICILSALGPVAELLARIPATAHAVLYAAAVLSMLLGAAVWYGRRRGAGAAGNWLRAIPVLQSARVRGFMAELRLQAVSMLRADARQNALLLLLTSLQWFARYSVLWMVLDALGHRLPFGFILALQAGVLHLAQWTGIPGGGGSADLGIAAALAPWLPAALIAPALSLWRLGTLYVPLALGGLAFAALGRNMLRHPHADADPA